MAKFVIAGRCDCPYFAKAELIGDQLAKNLPKFQVYKILKDTTEWEPFLNEICKKNSWKHAKSPLIWRESLDRGGKGMYIGDANDFQEYAKGYYGIYSELSSDDLKKISKENSETYRLLKKENEELQKKIKPFNITISHPSSAVTYYILPDLLNGNIFGAQRDINIKLYEREKMDIDLNGILMEVQDLATHSLRSIKIVNDAESAFKDCDLAILFDELKSVEFNKDEVKQRVIGVYSNPYVELAQQIDQYAKETCKILITPIEFHKQIMGIVTTFNRNLKRLNVAKNVIGNSMYDEMIAKSILAKKLRVSQYNIKDVVLMGQCIGESHYIDIAQAKVTGYDGAIWARDDTHWLSLVEMIADIDWMQKEFPLHVHERELQVDKALNRKSLLTFSQSVVKILSLWLNENNQDKTLHSVITVGKGNYSVTSDLCLSLPGVFTNGEFTLNNHFIVSGPVMTILTDIVKDLEKYMKERYEDDIFYLYDPNTPDPTPVPKTPQPKNPEDGDNDEEKVEKHVEFTDQNADEGQENKNNEDEQDQELEQEAEGDVDHDNEQNENATENQEQEQANE